MGCIESSVAQAMEMNFDKAKPHRTSVLIIHQNTVPDEDEIKIDEKLLCDDNLTHPITFTTRKNDIKPIHKEDLLHKSENISRAAIQKLIERKVMEKDSQKIKVDSSRLSRKIKKDIHRD
jgi:hypothetical protein